MHRKDKGSGELAELTGLDIQTLRERWTVLYKSKPSPRISKDVLIRAVAWALQAECQGGLSKSARRQLERQMETLDSSGTVSAASSPSHHKPGTRLIREWQGRVHEVIILDNGYLWSGTKYRSLSVIARTITGTRWSGPRFFGTDEKAERSPS